MSYGDVLLELRLPDLRRACLALERFKFHETSKFSVEGKPHLQSGSAHILGFTEAELDPVVDDLFGEGGGEGLCGHRRSVLRLLMLGELALELGVQGAKQALKCKKLS